MRLTSFVLLMAIAITGAACSKKCEQDSAALQTKIAKQQDENLTLRNQMAGLIAERDELDTRSKTVSSFGLRLALACTSDVVVAPPPHSAIVVTAILDNGNRVAFVDDMTRPITLTQTAKGHYELALAYRPKDDGEPIGQRVASLTGLNTLELHNREVLTPLNLHCASIAHLIVEVNGLDTLQGDNIPLAEATLYNTPATGAAPDTVDTRQFFSGVAQAYAQMADRRLHRAP
ncbi:MAG: hypothetical protein WCA81_15575 [Rhizomicrobium sp.]